MHSKICIHWTRQISFSDNLLLSFRKNSDLLLPWRKKSLHNPILPSPHLHISPISFQDHLLPSLQHQYDQHNPWYPFLLLLIHSHLSNEYQKLIIEVLYFTPKMYHMLSKYQFFTHQFFHLSNKLDCLHQDLTWLNWLQIDGKRVRLNTWDLCQCNQLLSNQTYSSIVSYNSQG